MNVAALNARVQAIVAQLTAPRACSVRLSVQHAVRLADGGEPAAPRTCGAPAGCPGRPPTSSASKPCAAAQPAHASQSARAAPWPRASGATHIAFSTAVPASSRASARAEPAVVVVGDDERALLLARLRQRGPRRPPLLRQARLALVGAAERRAGPPRRARSRSALHAVGLVREHVADVHSGSRPPALIVFIVNCEVIAGEAGQVGERVDQEVLVGVGVGDRDPDQVVGVAEHPLRLDHLVERRPARPRRPRSSRGCAASASCGR